MTKNESPTKDPKRPPIVTIVGHVDHGKTSLLDALLTTNRAAKEIGGITQSISAHSLSYQDRKITFVDTPGHAAFLAMRRRGGDLADIVLLVVDGVEGVKAQTKEAINQIKESSAYPIVVLTKSDLPGTQAELSKRQLAESGLVVEGLGGTVPVCQTSVKDEESLKRLLDLILLVTDLHDFGGRAGGPLEAVVAESFLDRRRGPLALVVVRSGTLRIGQEIFGGAVSGKARGLIGLDGENLVACPAGEACLVLGLDKVAPAGELLTLIKPETAVAQAKSTLRAEAGELKIVLKADTFGGLEAVLESLLTLAEAKDPTGRPLIAVVSSGVGDVTDGDVRTALESGATIIGFRVKVFPSALDLARDRGINIRTYEIIYRLLEDLLAALRGLLSWQKKALKGSARVLKIFVLPSGDQVLGARVENGLLKVGQNVVVKREETELLKSSIKQLRIVKDRVEKISAGQEGGLLLADRFEEDQIKPNDLLLVL